MNTVENIKDLLIELWWNMLNIYREKILANYVQCEEIPIFSDDKNSWAILSIFLQLENRFSSWKIFNISFEERIFLLVYEDHEISFQTFFVWALLLIDHTQNSSPLRSNLLRLKCTCCTDPTNSGRPHGSPLVWACQWPSLQPLSFPQLSHNDSL